MECDRAWDSGAGKRVVVISESVTSTDVNTKFRDVSTGTVVLENMFFDDMRMAGLTNNTDYGVSNDSGINLLTGPITNKFGALGLLNTTPRASLIRGVFLTSMLSERAR